MAFATATVKRRRLMNKTKDIYFSVLKSKQSFKSLFDLAVY